MSGEFKKVIKNFRHGGKFVSLLSDHVAVEYEAKFYPSDSDIRCNHLEIQ